MGRSREQSLLMEMHELPGPPLAHIFQGPMFCVLQTKTEGGAGVSQRKAPR